MSCKYILFWCLSGKKRNAPKSQLAVSETLIVDSKIVQNPKDWQATSLISCKTTLNFFSVSRTFWFCFTRFPTKHDQIRQAYRVILFQPQDRVKKFQNRVKRFLGSFTCISAKLWISDKLFSVFDLVSNSSYLAGLVWVVFCNEFDWNSM